MAFTGKSTYAAGATLPEQAEDVSDLVAIASPHETPLLDALDDAARSARSTIHEWIEDTLLPNTDTVNDSTYTDASADTTFVVSNGSRFRVGDQIRLATSSEVMLVTGISTNTLTVMRGYGGSTATALSNASVVQILGNASLEGDDAAAARFTNRTRKSNFTQIFASTVEVSGSELAVRQIGVSDELDYQKQQRTRELIRDLENCVINGRAPAATTEGSASVRRTMRGILQSITTNRFTTGVGPIPAGTTLGETALNAAMRTIWQQSGGRVDLILVGAQEKRAINSFAAAIRRFDSSEQNYRQMFESYESDYGLARIVLSRWVPNGSVLLLDSSRISVMPLAGRSFHYKPLATTGDRDAGQVIGEYTLEFRNENAHGVLSGFSE